ncbi:GNAT family N-acetyltransferase [Cohnella endophytica]|uniref:GNAT family N-acetyltransferase n=1 Tax=Cohnella endophytica TaxID=2419778 RepID=A0A494Y5J7_9BACL|nr:GNAT family N-acetyltransferase [Cohnella endophytica]RKP57967.1 GNAT family N-acetyltransferase [Cohnella endophytica]
MITRILQESDAQLYQEVRLSGLKTNPEAFGSTYDRESNFSLDAVKERIRPNKDKFVLGAFLENGTLSGIVTFVRETGIKTSHKGNVYGMYVTQEMRGKGLGRVLMLELIREARECDGLEQLNLIVVSNNESAKKLYRSVGFDVYGVERRALKYNGQYYDEDLMVLRL